MEGLVVGYCAAKKLMF